MQVVPAPDRSGPNHRRTRRRLHGAFRFGGAFTGALVALFACTSLASASSLYSAQLTGTPITLNVSGGNLGSGAGQPFQFVYGQYNWVAPPNENFHGFDYTSGSFSSNSMDPSGGISAGFGGDGWAGDPLLAFPFTSDCAISTNGSDWVAPMYSGNYGLAGTQGRSSCDSGGNTAWSITGYAPGMEIDSNNLGVGNNVGSTYHQLWMTAFCNSGGGCGSGDTAYASVTNLTAQVQDPQNQPANSLDYFTTDGNTSDWYQDKTQPITLAFNAVDPSGVCYLQATASGPATLTSGDLVGAPGIVNLGGNIGETFQNGQGAVCDGSENYAWTVPGSAPTGTYHTSVQADNAANYQQAGFNGNGAPTISAHSAQINIDDTPVTAVWENTSSGWSSNTSEKLDVTVGPSGIASGGVACTDNGSAVAATLVSGSTSGAGTSVWSVPTPQVAGAGSPDELRCSVTNGDANGALTGTSPTQGYLVDTTSPVIQLSNPDGYAPGSWTDQAQTVKVAVTGGPSGTSTPVCALDGGSPLTLTPDGNGWDVTVTPNGVHTLACSSHSIGVPALTGSSSQQVDLDAQVPLVSFPTGAGYALSSTYSADPAKATGQNWISPAGGTVTIAVSATEPTVLAGVSQIVCTVNGVDGLTLTNNPVSGTIAQNTPFLATFNADYKTGWIDGQNAIRCGGETVAHQQGADGSTPESTTTEYVDVDNPSWPSKPGGDTSTPKPGTCGISSVINDGGCAYSNGPSQTAWENSVQNITITADDTGAATPITSISCSGVPMDQTSWTASADPPDVDANNGMTVVATVAPSGGLMSCQATDAGGTSYQLGTYRFNISTTAPSGFFEPQGFKNAQANLMQVSVTTGDAGVRSVVLTATDLATGKVYAGSALTGNPADGSTAYMTLDPATGLYNLAINPQAISRADDIALVATVRDNAGNTAVLGGWGNGTRAVIPVASLPAPNVTVIQNSSGPITLLGGITYSQQGDPTLIQATARAGRWTTTGVSQAGFPAQLTAATVVPAQVVTSASENCTPTAKKGKKHHNGRARARLERVAHHGKHNNGGSACVASHGKLRHARALPTGWRQKVLITGTLTNQQTRQPIGQATVLVFETNLANGKVRLAGRAVTNASGSFSYRLAAGPNRRVDLIYAGAGDGSLHGSDTAFDASTKGRLKITTAKLVTVGSRMRIRGRLYGGSVPRSGALVQMWYRIEGADSGWEPFQPGRTSKTGRFTVRYPIAAIDRGATYQVKVTAATQNGWGYTTASSNIRTFHVQ